MTLDWQIDQISAFMALGEPDSRRSMRGIDMRTFDGAEPFMGGLAGGLGVGVREFEGITDIRAIGKIDIATLGENLDGDGGFSMSRVRVVSAKEVRGRVARIRPVMVEHTLGVIGGSGLFQAGSAILGWFGSEDWRPIEHARDGRLFAPESTMGVTPMFWLAARRPREWRVSLGYEGHPKVSFATDPHGAAEVFRLRDVPEGRSRRAALRGWVREHWRQKRDGALAAIPAHLRGAQRFSWNGLACVIQPSKDDLDLVAMRVLPLPHRPTP